MASTFRDRLLELADEYENLQRDHARLHQDQLRMVEHLKGTSFHLLEQGPSPKSAIDVYMVELDQPLLPQPVCKNALATALPSPRKIAFDVPITTQQMFKANAAIMSNENQSSNANAIVSPQLVTFETASNVENVADASDDEQPNNSIAIESSQATSFMTSSGTDGMTTISDDETSSLGDEAIVAKSSSKLARMKSTTVKPAVTEERTTVRFSDRKGKVGFADRLERSDLDTWLRLAGTQKPTPHFQQAFEAATVRGLEECYNTRKDFGVVSPLSIQRGMWDALLFFCILFELWVTPFDLFFLELEVMPRTFRHMSHGITAIFLLDIAINFNTGYIDKGDIHMTRLSIAKKYLCFWFWLDLVSSIPLDLIFSLMGSGFLRGIKIGKALRIFRTMRYVKMLQSVKLMVSMGEVSLQARLLAICQTVMRPFVPVCVTLVIAHVHACLWAALSPNQSVSSNIVDAIGEYYESFWHAWIGLFLGFAESPDDSDQFRPVMFFYILISLERICAFVVGGIWIVVYATVHLSDFMKLATMRENAIKYLQKHQISLETQVQLRFSLKEMAQASFQQQNFNSLVCSDHITAELHRRICLELWGSRLMAFGLITQTSTFHEDFVMELSLRVREEAFASKMVLFQYGDTAIAAYHVIRGQLESVEVPSIVDFSIEYGPGHWLGESALVNPSLRRALSVITKAMSHLMVIPANDFQDVLLNLGLTQKFQKFIQDHLWKGLCSRCGVLGDHFASECPGLKAHRYTKTLKKTRTTSFLTHQRFSSFGETVSEKMFRTFGNISDQPKTIQKDLLTFLTEKDLLKLKPWLLEFSVFSLDDLLEIDLAILKEACDHALEISEMEWEAISRDSIIRYSSSAAQAVQDQFFNTSVASHDYYMFLSHSKFDSGTEAALMRSELEQLIRSDPDSTLNDFEVPVFLDSEDLHSLTDLQEAVKRTHNLVLLLSPSLVQRGWVLVEIVTAVKLGVRIVPVHVSKPGTQFEFPKNDFYKRFIRGDLLDTTERTVMREAKVSLEDAAKALREVFRQIAVPYSPHKSSSMRRAELESLLKRCRLRDERSRMSATTSIETTASNQTKKSFAGKMSGFFSISLGSLRQDRDSGR